MALVDDLDSRLMAVAQRVSDRSGHPFGVAQAALWGAVFLHVWLYALFGLLFWALPGWFEWALAAVAGLDAMRAAARGGEENKLLRRDRAAWESALARGDIWLHSAGEAARHAAARRAGLLCLPAWCALAVLCCVPAALWWAQAPAPGDVSASVLVLLGALTAGQSVAWTAFWYLRSCTPRRPRPRRRTARLDVSALPQGA